MMTFIIFWRLWKYSTNGNVNLVSSPPEARENQLKGHHSDSLLLYFRFTVLMKDNVYQSQPSAAYHSHN